MEEFEQFGNWIYIDPDEPCVELIKQYINIESLCEWLRCEATDLLPLGDEYLGYVDGEGVLLERQTEWEFDGKPCWGPMLIFKMGADDMDMISCTEEDLKIIEPRVNFHEYQEFLSSSNLNQSKKIDEI